MIVREGRWPFEPVRLDEAAMLKNQLHKIASTMSKESALTMAQRSLGLSGGRCTMNCGERVLLLIAKGRRKAHSAAQGWREILVPLTYLLPGNCTARGHNS